MNFESNKITPQPGFVSPPGGLTPIAVAGTITNEFKDKSFVEDIVYYLQCYLDREYNRYEKVETMEIKSSVTGTKSKTRRTRNSE